MRAIIISNEELRSLLDQLKLKKLEEVGHYRNTQNTPEAIEESHRVFHYVVCRWIQEVGGEVTRS